MPWKTLKNGTGGEPWCVYRVDKQGRVIGEAVGCHESQPKAQSQMRALYASGESEESVAEAATYKKKLQALMRTADALLEQRKVPGALRKSVADMRAALTKTWADLAADAETEDVVENVDETAGPTQTPVLREAATSFGALFASVQTHEAIEKVQELTYQFGVLADNILWMENDAPARLSALRALSAEYMGLVALVLEPVGEETVSVEDEAEDVPGDTDVTELSEAWANDFPVTIIDIEERDGEEGDEKVLYVEFVPIRPGWGNKKDNHFYPAEVIAEAAPVWLGAKMYACDHDPAAKSVLTEVSQIVESPAGMTEDGTPTAKAVIFSPAFEEMVRKRKAAGLLESLECSILASGKAKPGFSQDGRDGKLVTAITSAESVDWVTKAGAGGHAIALSEQEEEMPEDPQLEGQSEEEEVTPAESESDVTISEADAAEAESAPLMEKAAVVEALAATALPDVSRARLAEQSYADQGALANAILIEAQYVSTLMGAGQPVGQTAQPAAAGNEFDISTAYAEIDERYGLAYTEVSK